MSASLEDFFSSTFLDVMPNEPCDSFLELCSGTGIAALVAARDFAKHAWATDIADRSTKEKREEFIVPTKTVAPVDLSLYMAAIGRKGGQIGGKRRL